MVQGYTQQDCGGKSGWASHLGSRRVKEEKSFSRTIFYSDEAFLCSYPRGVAHDQWAAYLPKEPKLSGVEAADRETGGSMLSVTGINRFYYLRDLLFTYDNRSYSLFEKKFVAGYQFMKVEREGGERVYRIDWKDVVLLLENPIVKTLKIR